MSSPTEPLRYAKAWAGAWNRADLKAVLASVAEEVRFVSPLAARIAGSPWIEGKAAIRRYWSEALRLSGAPRFTVDQAIWDESSRTLVIFYGSEREAVLQRRCELMRSDASGRQIYGEAFHGAEERIG